MKLTAKIRLQPPSDQYVVLLQTLEAANALCNEISRRAWESKTLSQFKLHKLVYADSRAASPLSSQMVVRAIAKVADAYKTGKQAQRAFHPHGAFPYDTRILSFNLETRHVSIWTLAGRLSVPFLAGERQMELLHGQRGEADLCYVRGAFYLFVACEVETPETVDVSEFLGVDLGIANIAADGDGAVYSGQQLRGIRHRYQRLRAKLQRKGTKSAQRLLKKRRRKEYRFAHDVNHCISKQLVKKAQGTGRGIALEKLKGIRERVTVRKSQRRQLHSWAFSDLRLKIAYKALMRGVPVVYVDPRSTSRQCSVCGHIDQASRQSQSVFLCTSCGHAAHADVNAAVNIGSRAALSTSHTRRAQADLLQSASAVAASCRLSVDSR